MHSLAPYMVRVYNPRAGGKPEDRYCKLNKVGQSDVFYILQSFIESKLDTFHVLEDSKQVYKFSNFSFEKRNRVACGWFQLGHYGVKTDIINVNTGEVDFEKTTENAEIINHFLYFYLPEDYNEGVALLHMFRGNGIKTVFYEMFKEHFQSATGFNLQMHPLAYDKAFKKWEKASAKEIRLIKFSGLTDIADKVSKLGHDEQILTLKPPKRGALGVLKDYFNKDSEQAKAIELLAPLCERVKTVVELNGRKRTFSIGNNPSNPICEIDAPDDLRTRDGNPIYSAIKKWCEEVVKEFSDALYKS